MQSLMRGFGSEAVDMAQGAFERAKGQAVPRVLAFTKLIGDEPAWIDFYAHSRLSADAAEIFRDLKFPRWP
jgi:hypothetical protein